MAQVLQIDPTVFDEAPNLTSLPESVASTPSAVAAAQPALIQSLAPHSMPVWYLTPVAVVPMAAAAFIVGNVLMMIPWSAF
jgi:hypothetical protein